MEPCQVYVSFAQFEQEPPIPLSLHLVFADGSSKIVPNELDTESLLAKYGDKLSPEAYQKFSEDTTTFFSLFETPKPYNNKKLFLEIPDYY